jgi:hypothetical protein
MSARPLTSISLMVSPGTQTPRSNRPASSRATVDFPAADTPEITNSDTPPMMSAGRPDVMRFSGCSWAGCG